MRELGFSPGSWLDGLVIILQKNKQESLQKAKMELIQTEVFEE